jgi:hypothetical protein
MTETRRNRLADDSKLDSAAKAASLVSLTHGPSFAWLAFDHADLSIEGSIAQVKCRFGFANSSAPTSSSASRSSTTEHGATAQGIGDGRPPKQ